MESNRKHKSRGEKCVQYKNIEKNIKMKIEKGLFDTHK